MFEWLFQRLETVHHARTREEHEAIYRFRYRVYVEELNKTVAAADHARQWIHEADDEAPTTTLLYVGTPSAVIGTLRLRHWEPGQVPGEIKRLYSMDVFPDLDTRRAFDISRLMIRPDLRGRMVMPALLSELYTVLVGDHHAELVFCDCQPGLVQSYRRMGMRPFGGRLIHGPDGVLVPLVCFPSDIDYARSHGALLAPLVTTYFGPGKRPALDLSAYRHLLTEDAPPIEVDPVRIWEEVQDEFLRAEDSTPTVLRGLQEGEIKDLTQQGFIIEVPHDTLVAGETHTGREMYVILEGSFEAFTGERRLSLMGKGDLFGEVAFFRESGRRTASVRSVGPGRVLVLRRHFIDNLTRRNPALAARLLFNLARIMSERAANMSALLALRPPDQVSSD